MHVPEATRVLWMNGARRVTARAAPAVTGTSTVTGGITATSADSASTTKKAPSWPTRSPSVTGGA